MPSKLRRGPTAAPAKLSSRILAALSGLFTLLVVFIAREVAARILRPLPPEPFRLDPSIGYEFKPFAPISGSVYHNERLNSEGFRSDDLPLAKGTDEFRILAVGDSTCFCEGVRRADSWPYILERLLNNPPGTKNVHMINARTPGYVSYQALERLKRGGLKYNPDVVVVMVGWNDLAFSALPRWKPNTDMTAFVFTRPAIAGSRLLYLLARKLNYLLTQPRPPSGQRRPGVPFNERALELFLDNMEAMRELSVAEGVAFAVVLWPSLSGVRPLPADVDQKVARSAAFPLSLREWREWHARYLAGLRQFASDHPEIILVDPTEAFATSPLKGDLFLDVVHLTPAGNRLLATVMAHVLAAAGGAAGQPRGFH